VGWNLDVMVEDVIGWNGMVRGGKWCYIEGTEWDSMGWIGMV
jgi:hypothetical protein